ncbi:hypothetical protein BHE74_00058237 [Ensete ventricosum]|nr:hypothetical protein BHE74_00058237 [Ensete ventricosum]RZS28691.1 hypothetical protein BHM03_00062326 [Ensete ventricosum]
MAWWDRVTSPMRRVWTGVVTRLGIRKSGEPHTPSFRWPAALIPLTRGLILPPPVLSCRAAAAEGGGEHVRVRGRARDVGAADGVGAGWTSPGGDGGEEEEEEAPAGRIARVVRARVGTPQLLPQVLATSRACRE